MDVMIPVNSTVPLHHDPFQSHGDLVSFPDTVYTERGIILLLYSTCCDIRATAARRVCCVTSLRRQISSAYKLFFVGWNQFLEVFKIDVLTPFSAYCGKDTRP